MDVSAKIPARVVFLTHYIPLYQLRVLQHLARSVQEFQVLLSTPIEPNRDFTPDWSDLDVTVQDTVTVRRKWRHRDAGFDDPLYVHFPYDTMRRLKALQPDVVMSLELGARSLGAAIHCGLHRDTKLILCTYMSQRTEQGRGWMRETIRKRLTARADAVTFNGPSCRQYLRGLGVSDDKLFALPYAADDRTTFRGCVSRDDSATRHRLLVAGQLSDRKGTLPLIEQITGYCNQRPDRSIELIFAGDGPLRCELNRRTLPSNLSMQILGNLIPADLSDLMTRCGVMIAPTLADEWMLVINESLQAGLPVIGSVHAQAVTTLVRDGFNGWQYDPMHPSELASKLDQYFDCSSTQLNEMRVQARRSVAERTPEWAAAGAIDAVRHVLGMTPECTGGSS